ATAIIRANVLAFATAPIGTEDAGVERGHVRLAAGELAVAVDARAPQPALGDGLGEPDRPAGWAPAQRQHTERRQEQAGVSDRGDQGDRGDQKPEPDQAAGHMTGDGLAGERGVGAHRSVPFARWYLIFGAKAVAEGGAGAVQPGLHGRG